MATVKDVIQNFCYRINVPAPASFVGVNSPTEQQYLSLFRFVGDNLRNRPYQWPQLKRGYTMTTTTGQNKIQLPGDFYRILESGQWDATNAWPLTGPVSDYTMNMRQFCVVSLQTRKAFRIVGPTQYLYNTAPFSQRSAGSFEIDPPADNSTDQLFLGYISANWVWPADWVTGAAYTAGVSIVGGNGQMFIAKTSGNAGATRPSGSAEISDGSVTWTPYYELYPISADTDLCLFDDDLMIEGMRWAYLRAKALDYQQERDDWENQVKSAYSRFNGPTRINMCDDIADYLDWPTIPQGSWSV